MSSLGARYSALGEQLEQVENGREQLDSDLQPYVQAWTEFCAEFEAEHQLNPHYGLHSFWAKIGYNIRPYGGYSYELDIEGADTGGFSFRGEDYDGGSEYFFIPSLFIENQELAKRQLREEWNAKLGDQLEKERAAEKEQRRRQFEALSKEFSDNPDVPGSRGPLSRSAFDEANPSQS